MVKVQYANVLYRSVRVSTLQMDDGEKELEEEKKKKTKE